MRILGISRPFTVEKRTITPLIIDPRGPIGVLHLQVNGPLGWSTNLPVLKVGVGGLETPSLSSISNSVSGYRLLS